MKPYFEEGGIQIFHGDAIEVVDVFPKRSFGMVITDPPYSSGARKDADRASRGSMLPDVANEDWFTHDAMTTWGFTWFWRNLATRLFARSDPGAHAYVFCDWRQMPNVYGMLESSGWRVNNVIVWDKLQPGMGTTWRNRHEMIVFASAGVARAMATRTVANLIAAVPVAGANKLHPTQKPTDLIRRVLEVNVRPDLPLIDPFLGSGTTLVVAKQMGWAAVGCDVEEKWCELSARRVQAAARISE